MKKVYPEEEEGMAARMWHSFIKDVSEVFGGEEDPASEEENEKEVEDNDEEVSSDEKEESKE